MFMTIAAIAALVPLTETQADVLTTLTFVGIGGNVAEHWKEALREALAARTGRTGGGGSGVPWRSAPGPEEDRTP